MADFAHLEKMGRELKCPICLSLLSSAASLTCNHVFCNLCLTKSMKADSSCPVCKVPYRRREIRPAPHMDNLVSIYKTMEVASGVNIHVTQNEPSTKTSVDKNQIEGNTQSDKQKTGELSRGKRKKQSKSKKGSMVRTSEENSDPQLSMKPSFPAKKRVHVPQCLESETPTRTSKYEQRLGEKAEKGPWDGSNVLKEKPSFTARGEPVFSPFFWIRERDDGDKDEVERLSSQTMEIDRVADTPSQKFSFSDIKESNTESPAKSNDNEKVDSPLKLVDVFDSEMFEWTQKPCSPELCSTPVKNKVASQNEFGRVQQDNEAGSQYHTAYSSEEPVSKTTKQGKGSVEMESFSSQKDKTTKMPNGRTKSNKSGNSKRKRAVPFVNEAHGNADGSCQGNDCCTNATLPNTANKTLKKNKKATFGATGLNRRSEEALQSIEDQINNQGDEDMGKSVDLSPEKFESLGKQKKVSWKTPKMTQKSQRNHCKNQNQNVDTTGAMLLKEISINQIHRNEIQRNKSPLPALQKDNGGSKASLASMKVDIQDQQKCDENLREGKRLRVSRDGLAKGGLASEILKECSSKTAVKKAQTVTGLQKDHKNKAVNNIQPMNKVPNAAKDMSLKKCERTLGQVCCAFCQSSKDSEVSGKMVHYSSGRPVAPDYNDGSGIIHAHRNCSEWAPNVYFEDKIAINLESELSRSRRIKCSLCGIKGAALGCYETSCRKSFHLPCAKLVQQCRWDNENFVMLCPLHPSSKLPKETSGSQGKRRKQYTPQRKSQSHQTEVMVNHGVSANRSWKGSSSKLVLCCSGLSSAEKEIISEFSKMTGISISKTFGPNVTHIIASTDENGACRRTLKFLLGILEGKWILKIDWVKACIKSMEPVAEEEYEISVDIHGIRDGPRLGRLRIQNNQPKLFNGCDFYFIGEFLPSYKGYLQDMVVAAGGTVLQRKPISGDRSKSSSASSFVIYNADEECDSAKKSLCHCRRDEAVALATSTAAIVAGHSWILDSIAACTLQTL